MIDVVILAAGSIKKKLHFARYCFDSPALVPINVKSIASHVLDFYSSKDNVRLHIAVNKDDYETVKTELAYYKDKVNFVPVLPTAGVVETLQNTINTLPENSQEIIVNLVTTVPTVFAESNEVFISDKLQKSNAWSSITFSKTSINFHFKDASSLPAESYAFTGVFRCNKRDLCRALKSEKINPKDLLSLVEALNLVTGLLFKKIHWLDCGHESNYYETRMDLISSRSFNNVTIDRITGIITKSSSNIDKLENEINYINMLPKNLFVFYPRILSGISSDNGRAYVDMEYYGYPTVSEYMLFWMLEEDSWKQLFRSLKLILKKQSQYQYSIGKKAYMDFYYTKCFRRIEQFASQLSADQKELLFCEHLTINGNQYSNFEQIKPDILNKLESLYNEKDFCIMHGDFCFNNILYDLNSGIVRLIDARGSFGEQCVGIYGDIKYDLAKLTHSIMGFYDYIVNHKFNLKRISNTEFAYSINKRPWHDFLCDQNKLIIKELGFNVNDILFLVGLILVSICPLHNDSSKRQMLMYLHGVRLLNETLKGG